ncbi:MAG: hypothetical protein FJ123_00960 [Deltaproteobacteria bacterium]|nr:hypothetical protein [Deltaproteobacteria bacterium]
MSEVARYQTVIQIPSLAKRVRVDSNLLDADPRSELLKKALEIVLQEHGGTMSQDIRDCDGKRISCLIGIKPVDFPRGIGLNVDRNGKVVFVYDSHGDSEGLGQKICEEISQYYNTIALRLALSEMDYQVDIEEEKTGPYQKKVLLTGRI